MNLEQKTPLFHFTGLGVQCRLRSRLMLLWWWRMPWEQDNTSYLLETTSKQRLGTPCLMCIRFPTASGKLMIAAHVCM